MLKRLLVVLSLLTAVSAVPAQAQMVCCNVSPKGPFGLMRHWDLHGSHNAAGSLVLGAKVTALNIGPVQTLGLGIAGRASIGNPAPDSRFGLLVTSPIANVPFTIGWDSIVSVGANLTYDVERKGFGVSYGISFTNFF